VCMRLCTHVCVLGASARGLCGAMPRHAAT
jgi:hypothetical protein